MNRIQFGEGGCERARKYLDSYISNELLVETNHEVMRHVENCPACTSELDARTRLRTRLKTAVNAQPVPPELAVRIRSRVGTSRPRTWLPVWAGLATAMAAGLVVALGLWLSYSRERMPALADRPGQTAYIERASATLAVVLKAGLADHIHCAVFRKYPKTPPPVEKLEADLGPTYRGLLPVVRTAVPEGYQVVMAHRCSYGGRKYIHVTFERNGELLSLVVARKERGESMSGLLAASQVSGLPIYDSAAGHYHVAGFDAGEYLAYVVSDLRGKSNLQIATRLAPGVHAFLVKTPA
jgi:anti-sigma factor (TIGR02949 family)